MVNIKITVDYENNAECWWAAFNVAPNIPPELQGTWKEVIVSAERAKEIEEWCASLPGWEDGPTYAPTALIFNPTSE